MSTQTLEIPEALAARVQTCVCGRPIFFRNSECVACSASLGYEPVEGIMRVIQPDDTDYRRCANFETASGCNWLIAKSDAAPLCVACRLDRTIPDLSVPGNDVKWRRIEDAKRKLIASLLRLGIVPKPKSEEPQSGLAFDFLADTPNSHVLIGHGDGVITLNIEEAVDSQREKTRESLNEHYRTILGHLRHESGHYYWDLLVAPNLLDSFRQLFGDEQADYAAALKTHYEQGPAAQWDASFVSAYASSHPWEDWAETWAHYLHMRDTMETWLRYELHPADALPCDTFSADALAPGAPDRDGFLELVNTWVRLTPVLNELSASMGLADFYPFVLSKQAVQKLHFVHRAILTAPVPASPRQPVSAAG